MADIHPTAVVAAGARIGVRVTIGPYCVIGQHVVLCDGVTLKSHVVVDGHTTIGEDSTVFPFASLGTPPQDLKFKGEPSRLEIGKRNSIREHATMNPGTAGGGMLTRTGDDCLLMIGIHVAHDCRLGNHVIMANNATLGGHVHIGDWAFIGGLAAIHQFVRIGAHAIVGGMSGVESDIIPYGSAFGDRARLRGLNLVGLQRRNFSREDIHTLRTAYRLMFAQEGTLAERLADVEELYRDNAVVMEIVAFIRGESSRSILQPKGPNGA
ncbi:MAG: acyl-ACP--UDP-N-acetylglucosamine O-acyltransferase [Alphaproteobacteria bacterium]|nr:acyl-ACP--UDP-N-acetylglucosamine O-acyltransferase [Alphaproteobacteria bacterium]